MLLKTDSYLRENQLNLNADKTELLFFLAVTNWIQKLLLTEI